MREIVTIGETERERGDWWCEKSTSVTKFVMGFEKAVTF